MFEFQPRFILFEVSFMKLLDVETCNHYFGVKEFFWRGEKYNSVRQNIHTQQNFHISSRLEAQRRIIFWTIPGEIGQQLSPILWAENFSERSLLKEKSSSTFSVKAPRFLTENFLTLNRFGWLAKTYTKMDWKNA